MVVAGGTVSEVVESQCEGWSVGDLVVGYYGWTEYTIATADDIQWNLENMPIEKWDGELGEPSMALGIFVDCIYTIDGIYSFMYGTRDLCEFVWIFSRKMQRDYPCFCAVSISRKVNN